VTAKKKTMRAAAARRTRRRRARAVVGLIALTSCGAGWVDPDSPSSAQSTTEIGGSDEYDLVYSDEFEVARRAASRFSIRFRRP